MKNIHPTVYTLQNDLLHVEVLPSIGGKILSIRNRKTGREWMWTHPFLGLTPPINPTGYHDSGGHDECFPTIAPCQITRSIDGEMDILDHGELWHLPWSVDTFKVQPSGGGNLDLSIPVPKLRCVFRRRLDLHPNDGKLGMEYTLENQGDEALPFLWAGHALIKLESGMRLSFPKNSVGRVEVLLGNWPGGEKGHYPLTGSSHLEVIPDVDHEDFEGYCFKAFVEKYYEGWASIQTSSGEEFRFVFSPDEMDCVALWMNCRGWAGSGTEPYFNLGFEPMIGAADSLGDVLREGGKTGLVPPHSSQQWRLDLIIN